AADAAYIYGWQAIYYALGLSLGLFILSIGIGARLRNKKISTIPQIFSDLYKDKLSYKFCSIIYIISTFLILIAIAVATKKYLIAIDFYNIYIFLGFWLSLIIYTSIGGLKAVVKTDIMQISGVLIIFLITIIYLLFNPIEISKATNINNELNIPWSSWLLMPFLFVIIGQDMGQRCFAGASAKNVSTATFLAGFLLLISSLLPTYLGIVASQLGINMNENSSILIAVINQVTNPSISALFSFAILMAIISTADSLLCAISSNIAIDIFTKQRDKPNVIVYARIITLISGIMAFLFSLYVNNIIQIMVKAYELTIVCFFVPIIVAIFSSKPSKTAARISIIFGTISYLVLTNTFMLPKEILCLIISSIGYTIGYILEKNINY
ncbi:MAG: hypothetical protein HRT87_05565, partial [Legionellales bacterium]|nr:hypothetical protein [Legionellales bacterium]